MPIFDQGYQHWQGPLSSHAWRWLAIARHGVRVQGKNRFLLFLLVVAWLPAIALVVGVAVWGMIEQRSQSVLGLVSAILPADILLDPKAYRGTVWTLAYSFFFKFQMFFIMLLVVVAGPGLISRDLRFNALPLYFARPLTRFDYFLGKLGVIGSLVAAVAVGPAVIAYVVGICFSLDLSVVKDTYKVLLASIAYGLVITLSVGTLMLALSSLTRRSLYVGITWAGFWIISGSVGGIMTGIHQVSVRTEVQQENLSDWLAENPPPPGVELRRGRPMMTWNPEKKKVQLTGVAPGHEAEADRWFRRWTDESQRAWNKGQDRVEEKLRRDWRPICSYVANLGRLADAMLDTKSAWQTIDTAMEKSQAAMNAFGPRRGGFGPAPARPTRPEPRFANQMVPQYPWEWSAGVLAGLLGISIWTMTRRVKSLDRLK